MNEKAIASKLRELADEVDKPKEEWVDVTSECRFEPERVGAPARPSWIIRVFHQGSSHIALWRNGSFIDSYDHEYQVDTANSMFRIMKRAA